MTSKKKPLRMCIACREMKEKSCLVRVVKTPEGEITLDKTGRKNGRGAYICKCEKCFNAAEKTNALSRAFATAVDREIYESLKEELKSIE